MTLKYPADIDGSRDFVKFTIGNYNPPVAGGNYVSNLSDLRGDTIILNMPSDIGSSFSGAWGGKNTTGLAQLALNAVKGVGEATKNGKTFRDPAAFKSQIDTKTSGDTLKNIFGAAIEDAVTFLGDTLGQAPGLGGNLTANDFLQIGTGTIINPNTELFYGGPSLRTHGYSFKLIPQSKDEAKNILEIVERFKKACLPTAGEAVFGGTYKNFIGVPEVCQIQFCGSGGGENPNLPKYKISAFTAVSTSYITDGGYMSFRDGEPIGINLTLALTELKLVFRDDIGSTAR
jgi:hypothetical protein